MAEERNHIAAFGELLSKRMVRIQSDGDTVSCDFGQINADMSLSIDSLDGKIPRGEYMISLHLSGQSGSDLHTGKTEDHTHSLPSTLRGLKSGDRVLVAWAGPEPIVVDILISS